MLPEPASFGAAGRTLPALPATETVRVGVDPNSPPSARAWRQLLPDQFDSSTLLKLPSGSCEATAPPMARPIARIESPSWRVSWSGRSVGCTIDRTPGRGLASPQLSTAALSGISSPDASVVSSMSCAKDTTTSTLARASAKPIEDGREKTGFRSWMRRHSTLPAFICSTRSITSARLARIGASSAG